MTLGVDPYQKIFYNIKNSILIIGTSDGLVGTSDFNAHN